MKHSLIICLPRSKTGVLSYKVLECSYSSPSSPFGGLYSDTCNDIRKLVPTEQMHRGKRL